MEALSTLTFPCEIASETRRLPIKNEADCVYDSVLLPPSHALHMVQSLVCREQERCANDCSEHIEPEGFMKHFAEFNREMNECIPTFKVQRQ